MGCMTMKNFMLMITLLIIAAGTGISVFIITLDSDMPNCNDCMVRIDSTEEITINKFCYPSIYTEYVHAEQRKNDDRVFPKTGLYAERNGSSVCMQMATRPEYNVVSF